MEITDVSHGGSGVCPDIGGFFSNREQENDGFLFYSYCLQVSVCIISLAHLWVLISIAVGAKLLSYHTGM